jgi:ABC-2 type transport system permease protein
MCGRSVSAAFMLDMSKPPAHLPAFGVKRIAHVNFYGTWTLYAKEVRRFLKVYQQTLTAPAVTTLLYLAIFVVAIGQQGKFVLGVRFADFIAPGLIIMAMIQNAFANTSSSMIIGKVQGSIIDTLMPPLSPTELTLAFVAGAVTRGFLVGLSVWLAILLLPNIDVHIHALWAVLYFGFMGTIMLGLLGILTGLWAEKFDHSAAITNFIVQPLSLLSGTFYTLASLPTPWREISLFNPFFHIIDGFRYGFIGVADAPLLPGALALLALNGVLWLLCYSLFKSGWHTRA